MLEVSSRLGYRSISKTPRLTSFRLLIDLLLARRLTWPRGRVATKKMTSDDEEQGEVNKTCRNCRCKKRGKKEEKEKEKEKEKVGISLVKTRAPPFCSVSAHIRTPQQERATPFCLSCHPLTAGSWQPTSTAGAAVKHMAGATRWARDGAT